MPHISLLSSFSPETHTHPTTFHSLTTSDSRNTHHIYHSRNPHKPLPAFTLVEMMMVIAIIGILAAIIYPLGSMYLSQARDTSRQNAILQLARAHEAYFTDYNAYPTRNTQEGRENCVSIDLTS